MFPEVSRMTGWGGGRKKGPNVKGGGRVEMIRHKAEELNREVKTIKKDVGRLTIQE